MKHIGFTIIAALSLLALAVPTSSAGAQQEVPNGVAAKTGTIVVAHGASKEWNDQIRAVVSQARLDGPVEIAFLMGPEAATTRFQDVADRLVAGGADRLVVVPMLVSSYSEHYQQIRYLAGATDSIDVALHSHMDHGGLAPARVNVPVIVTRALDDSPAMARVLAERAIALSPNPANSALFLVGHGPNSAEDYAHWMENLRPVADTVKRLTGFRDVRVDLVRDDAPPHVRAEAVRRMRELIALQAALTGRDVVVVPVLISRGRISRETFLADLAGLPVIYSGDPLLPHAGLARWIEDRVRESTPATRMAVPTTR